MLSCLIKLIKAIIELKNKLSIKYLFCIWNSTIINQKRYFILICALNHFIIPKKIIKSSTKNNTTNIKLCIKIVKCTNKFQYQSKHNGKKSAK